MVSTSHHDKSYCSPHRKGVSDDAPLFFVAGCITCEAKKKAGKVTGLEGPLVKGWHKKRGHVHYGKRP